eukprot:CAMPEP_0204532076 /NCGR_PEP_ID=MMETSP0661-20131031/11531_1 /ASSEMBLY_ACC=CAM_ASM_000606 /TAXON_ID=109239 /ORGANISM="Alexandrium margalefi, Strain AMGDE01CS-322" /LENGTH=51 /DNA_ID=CAMNT_0051538291 /DNA_START=236 /DNA_END=392 /DNA_ORIENTATION=+
MNGKHEEAMPRLGKHVNAQATDTSTSTHARKIMATHRAIELQRDLPVHVTL